MMICFSFLSITYIRFSSQYWQLGISGRQEQHADAERWWMGIFRVFLLMHRLLKIMFTFPLRMISNFINCEIIFGCSDAWTKGLTIDSRLWNLQLYVWTIGLVFDSLLMFLSLDTWNGSDVRFSSCGPDRNLRNGIIKSNGTNDHDSSIFFMNTMPL